MKTTDSRKKELQKNRKIIGERIKLLRERYGYGRTALSRELGLPQNSIGQYERGETAPQSLTLVKLAEKFNTSVDYIVGYTEDPAPVDAREINVEDLLDKAWIYKGVRLTESEKEELYKMIRIGLNLVNQSRTPFDRF